MWPTTVEEGTVIAQDYNSSIGCMAYKFKPDGDYAYWVNPRFFPIAKGD